MHKHTCTRIRTLPTPFPPGKSCGARKNCQVAVLDSGSEFLIFPFFFFSYSHSPVESNLSDILSRFCLLIHSWMAQHLP